MLKSEESEDDLNVHIPSKIQNVKHTQHLKWITSFNRQTVFFTGALVDSDFL